MTEHSPTMPAPCRAALPRLSTFWCCWVAVVTPLFAHFAHTLLRESRGRDYLSFYNYGPDLRAMALQIDALLPGLMCSGAVVAAWLAWRQRKTASGAVLAMLALGAALALLLPYDSTPTQVVNALVTVLFKMGSLALMACGVYSWAARYYSPTKSIAAAEPSTLRGANFALLAPIALVLIQGLTAYALRPQCGFVVYQWLGVLLLVQVVASWLLLALPGSLPKSWRGVWPQLACGWIVALLLAQCALVAGTTALSELYFQQTHATGYTAFQWLSRAVWSGDHPLSRLAFNAVLLVALSLGWRRWPHEAPAFVENASPFIPVGRTAKCAALHRVVH